MFHFFSKPAEPIKLWFDTDIHCHVLPGVDDGSPDVETSVTLVRELGELGIKRIMASPHITRTTFENTPESLNNAQRQLDAALVVEGLTDIPVTHHAENRVDDLLQANLEAGKLLTLPGNYLLIENSFAQELWNLETVIFDLQVRGYRPIMAHPERYMYYHSGHMHRYRKLHEVIPFQMNVLSLAGYYGRHIKRMAEEMVEAGMVDFMGTDTHGTRHTECLREYLTTSDARRHAKLLAPKIQNHIFG